ncbi:hypothetical protein F2Q69_00047698 [Brassica cretica]|uniref:Uncharacterized protein n=1 Tax=Brassica cretica TaxID=69181 RepID=A0A8S9PZG0_BRACR|nr:hypothetical protein F2Q69_00047698 [Brassica cretica]
MSWPRSREERERKIDGKALPNSPKTQPATLCSLSEISVKLRVILWGNLRLIQKDLGDGIVMVGKLTFPAFYSHHDHAFTRGFVRRFPGEPERVRKRVRYLWKALVSRNLYQLTVSCLDFQIARTVFQPLYSEFTFNLRAKLVLKDGCYKLPHVFSSRDHRSKIVAVLHHGISGPSRLFPAVLNLILNSLLAELYRRGHLQIVKLVSSNGDFSHIYTAGLAPWPCSAPPSKKKLRSSPMVKF